MKAILREWTKWTEDNCLSAHYEWLALLKEWMDTKAERKKSLALHVHGESTAKIKILLP